MATGTTVIQTAMEDLGVLATGGTASPEELAYGLVKLNNLIGSWSYEELLLPYQVTETLSVAGSLSSRTIGSGADWDTARPVMIESLWWIDAESVNHPVQMLDSRDYGALEAKAVMTGRPLRAYYEPVDSADITRGTLYFDRTTDATETLHMISLKELTELATVGTTISLPTPWIRALIASMKLELAGKYGKPLTEADFSIATNALQNVTRLVGKYRKTSQEVVEDAVRSQMSVPQ